MDDKRWAINVYSQWRDGGYIAFNVLQLGFDRLKGEFGHTSVFVTVLGLSLTVTRYAA